MAELLIRERVQAWAQAISAKDLERVMAVYEADVCSFDLNPPLRYAGNENKRQAWQKFFSAFPDSISYEVNELSVAAAGDVAFAHSLNHVKGRGAGGQRNELWVRWTACFRCVEGEWRIAHDHASVPADLAHERAVVDITPEDGARAVEH